MGSCVNLTCSIIPDLAPVKPSLQKAILCHNSKPRDSSRSLTLSMSETKKGEALKRSVWIFARPLQFATVFGSHFVSHGKYPFCHWGVLITDLEFDAVKQILISTECTTALEDDVILGDMWELFHRENDTNEIDVVRPFKASHIREDWDLFSSEKLGETFATDEEIQAEGKSL